jgi:LysM repeat protein
MDTRSLRHRNPLRILAPVGLLVFGIALVLVISSASGGGPSSTSSNAAQKRRDLGPTAKTKRSSSTPAAEKLPQSVYVVKANDTLEGIAQKTGVPVARLLELNTGIDQFSLVAGQRIKLR